MFRRSIATVLVMTVVLLTGCSLVTDGEYVSSSEHAANDVGSPIEVDRSVEVANYQELYTQINDLVSDYIEYASIQFVSYTGDAEEDLARACQAVTRETPLGSYAVYYIDYSINKIVSYYEADVTVIYRRTKDEIEGITGYLDYETLVNDLKNAMSAREENVAFSVEGGQLDEDSIAKAMEEAYYSCPENILYFPEYTVSFYPELGEDYIAEMSCSYPYTASTVASRLQELNKVAYEAVVPFDGQAVSAQVEGMCDYLAQSVEFDQDLVNADNYSRWYNSYTAYGALVLHRAAGEGYAMAMKLMCDKLGIECYVVRGRLDNVNHAWNIIRHENGSFYHVDSSAQHEDGEIFWNDEQVAELYWWDTALYPECEGEPLYGEQTPASGHSGSQPPEGPDKPQEQEPPEETETPDEPDTQGPEEPDAEEPGGEDDAEGQENPDQGGENGQGDGDEETPSQEGPQSQV